MISQRCVNMKPSATVELTAKVAKMKKIGKDVIDLNVGEPDFETPSNICEAAIEAINGGFTKYVTVNGILDLRQSICKKLKKDNNLVYQPENIIVSTGAKQSLNNAVLAVCNEGDEVIIPTPCWVSYEEITKLSGAVPVFVKTYEKDGYQLNIDNIKKVLSPRTKGIILNTPNNPTGAVYSRESLKELGEIAVEHDLLIISDEVYEKLVYDDAKHVSIASLSDEIYQRTVTINGFSKAYAMTGWRIGYAAGPEKIIKAMSAIQGHMTHAANSITQKAAIEALEGPQESLAIMRDEFEKRRNLLLNRLNRMNGVSCINAKGAFYLLPNVSKLYKKSYKGVIINDSLDLTNLLLEECLVATVPGDAFESPDSIRLSYSNSYDKINEAASRMEKFFEEIK